MTTIPRLFIPQLSGKDFTLMRQTFGDTYIYLPTFILLFLLAWASQLSTILSGLKSKDELRQLVTSRFISSSIQKNDEVRRLAAAIAVTRTLGFEAQHLQTLKPEERKTYLTDLVEDLVTSSPPRGVKVLNPGQITSENIRFHRFGIMATFFGYWQATPFFEPQTVLRGVVTSTLDLETFTKIAYDTLDKIFVPDIRITDIEVSEAINNCLFPVESGSEDSPNKSFNDGILINDNTNKTPIEIKLKFDRPKPKPLPDLSLAENETDLVLKAAIEQNINDRKAVTSVSKNIKRSANLTTTGTPPKAALSSPNKSGQDPVNANKAKTTPNTVTPKKKVTRKKKADN